MKVIKPGKLSVLTRCVEHERRVHFGVSVLAFVPLTAEPQSAGEALLSEVALWTFVGERLGPQVPLEVGVPKSRAEFLVHGSCFAPGGVPHPRVPVHIKVGDVERGLMVTGDRYWTPSGAPSEPQPFTQMSLDWSRAYGGPKFKRNPLGRGHGESDYMGQRVQVLPNIEESESLVERPRDRPEPVGLVPIDISWPQRRELAGTYDGHWLENLFPGVAKDVDWRLFNLAQPAQQREQFWEGGEPYRLDNLHPTKPVLEGQLPRMRARAFVGRSVPVDEAAREVAEGDESSESSEVEGPIQLEPVDLSLRTVWLFPDAERAVLIYQGSTFVEQPDGTDVTHLVIAAEDPEHERPAEHYAQVLESRLDPDKGAIAALREHELLPAGATEVVDPSLAAEQALFSTERALEHNLHRRAVAQYEHAAGQLRAQGIDPDAFGLERPEPPAPQPSPDELPDLVERLRAEADERRAKEEAEFEQSREQLGAKLEALGFSPQESKQLVELHKQGQGSGPPTFTAEGQRAAVNELLEQTRAAGGPTEQLEQILADPAIGGRWEQAEVQLRDNYRKTAHLQDPAPRMSSERSEQARAVLHQAVQDGADVSRLNFTGADLSGADLSGANLAGALLESACLDGADLRKATLTGAVLAHASLRNARLDGVDLRGANLGSSAMQKATVSGADLSDAELGRADLTGASLEGSRLQGAHLLEVVLTDVDARTIDTERLVLVRVEATGLRLSGAQLRQATFVELNLRGADLTGACLTEAAIVDCDLQEVSFAGADLRSARFVSACRLDGARFMGASMEGANLRGSAMKGCDLSEAGLDGADLSECRLGEARFYRARARATRFEKADLRDATLVAANLMNASFISATIAGADLRGSNLHAADMARVITDDRVRLDNALLTRVRIYPRHEESSP